MDNTNTNRCGYIPGNLYIQKEEPGQIWPVGLEVSALGLEESHQKKIINRKHFAVASVSSHAFSSETEVGPLSSGKMFYKVVKFTWKLS